MNSLQPHDIRPGPDESLDSFLNGKIRIIQPKRGYRFSADAVHLARFVTIKKGNRVIDLGTGCGIIMMIILSTKTEPSLMVGVEIQNQLCSQAKKNIILNEFDKNAYVVIGDIREVPIKKAIFDVAICNPPYHPVLNGRINPDTQKAIARHELTLSLDDILKASQFILKPKGRLAMVYPSDRLSEIMDKMKKRRLEPKRVQFIHPNEKSESRLMLIESILEGRAGLKVLPPLYDSGHP